MTTTSAERHADEQAARNDRTGFPYDDTAELAARVAEAHPNYSTGPDGPCCQGCGAPILAPGGNYTLGWTQHVAAAAVAAARTKSVLTGEQWDTLGERLFESLDDADTRYAMSVVRTWLTEATRAVDPVEAAEAVTTASVTGIPTTAEPDSPVPLTPAELHADEQAAGNDRSAFPYARRSFEAGYLAAADAVSPPQVATEVDQEALAALLDEFFVRERVLRPRWLADAMAEAVVAFLAALREAALSVSAEADDNAPMDVFQLQASLARSREVRP